MGGFIVNATFDMKIHQEWIAHRKPVLHFYEDYSFIREINTDVLCQNVIDRLSKSDEIWQSSNCGLFINHLKWDTAYFGIETFKITGCLFGPLDPKLFFEEIKLFLTEFYLRHPQCKIFMEVPSEDLELIQALTYAGLRLVEGRLVHFKHPLQYTEKIAYRKAAVTEGPSLGAVASKMRNPADRFHADLLFNNEKADQYLYTYAKACAEGFTDVVIVPDEPGIPSNSFVAINYRKEDRIWNLWKPAQIVLAAVDSESNRGWYKKLIRASINHVMDEGAGCLYNTTQITNKVVIHTLESMGFKLGCARIILSN